MMENSNENDSRDVSLYTEHVPSGEEPTSCILCIQMMHKVKVVHVHWGSKSKTTVCTTDL